MKKLLFALIATILLSSCTQRSIQEWKTNHQYTSRRYEITMYSGGQVVFKDQFEGIINNNKNSDGVYYFKGDTMIEVSGDYTIKSIN